MSAGNMNEKNYLAKSRELLAGSEFYRNSTDETGREYLIVHANTAVRWYADGYAEPHNTEELIETAKAEAKALAAQLRYMEENPHTFSDVRALYEAVAHAHNALKAKVGFCYITEKGKRLAAGKG